VYCPQYNVRCLLFACRTHYCVSTAATNTLCSSHTHTLTPTHIHTPTTTTSTHAHTHTHTLCTTGTRSQPPLIRPSPPLPLLPPGWRRFAFFDPRGFIKASTTSGTLTLKRAERVLGATEAVSQKQNRFFAAGAMPMMVHFCGCIAAYVLFLYLVPLIFFNPQFNLRNHVQ
jgi:hypothetical protein